MGPNPGGPGQHGAKAEADITAPLETGTKLGYCSGPG